jgi:cell division protein FtsZ
MVQQYARIRVVGVGSGGVTAVNQMIAQGLGEVDFVTIDGDDDQLERSAAPVHIPVSVEWLRRASEVTVKGGQGSRLESFVSTKAGRALRRALRGSDMVFLVGGLGGRTGTHLAPAVASLARAEKALTVAIVTFPYSFEGRKRAEIAQQGVVALRRDIDTLIVIPNDRLLELSGGELGFHETYRLARDVWCTSIRAMSELVNKAGIVNVDFADVRTVMKLGGASVITTGSAVGPHRARRAAREATESPLLGITIDGARGVVFNIVGGPDLCLSEVEQVAAVIRGRVHPDANLIFGAAVDESLGDELAVTVIATGCGVEWPQAAGPSPAPRLVRARLQPQPFAY